MNKNISQEAINNSTEKKPTYFRFIKLILLGVIVIGLLMIIFFSLLVFNIDNPHFLNEAHLHFNAEKHKYLVFRLFLYCFFIGFPYVYVYVYVYKHHVLKNHGQKARNLVCFFTILLALTFCIIEIFIIQNVLFN